MMVDDLEFFEEPSTDDIDLAEIEQVIASGLDEPLY